MSSVVCPYCFTLNSHAGTCSNCGERLLASFDGSESTISIVGSTWSGKSHYIAVLIEQLYRQAERFQWSCRALNDETLDLYQERFKNPLYSRGLTINKTQTADVRAHRPLIYSLRMNDARIPPVTLTFYDAAGERFNDQDSMATSTRYLRNSSGVVFIVDPLQLESVRERFLSSGQGTEKDLPPRPNDRARVGAIFQRMINVLQERESGEKIQTPLALGISKIDALRFLLSDEAPVFLPSLHRRRRAFSVSDFRRVDAYFRSFLQAFDVDREILANVEAFENVGFFGFSALGQNPERLQKLNFEPRPIRVLDPFLWLLWQNETIAEAN